MRIRLARCRCERSERRPGLGSLVARPVVARVVEVIGERLGIGATAAQSLLARARVAFREALEKVFGAEAADIAASLGA